MLDRPRSRLRLSWVLAAVVLFAVAVVLLSSSPMSPVRDIASRLTLPVQRVLHTAGSDARSVVGSVGDLATLRTRNEELESLVASLTVENLSLREVEAENARLRSLLSFAESNPGYDIKGSQVIGRVVSSEPSDFVQSILIDRGSTDGIAAGMPVVTERGLVGRIAAVYHGASRVLLITDSSSGVNGMLQNSRLRGVVHGRAGQLPIMDYLPPQEPVLVGDIVVTSGEGGSFPKGIPIGQVVEVEHNDVEMFQRAVVRTTVDFNTLETVLVITDFVPLDSVEP